MAVRIDKRPSRQKDYIAVAEKDFDGGSQKHEIPASEGIAGLIASGNYRLAMRKRWFRRPLIILEQREDRLTLAA